MCYSFFNKKKSYIPDGSPSNENILKNAFCIIKDILSIVNVFFNYAVLQSLVSFLNKIIYTENENAIIIQKSFS